MKNLLTESLISRARKEFAQGVESFFMSIPVFGGLLVKFGNTYQKATIPVTLQRNSEERDAVSWRNAKTIVPLKLSKK